MTITGFNVRVSVTHIGTATAIIDIDGVRFLTDPFFSPAGTAWDVAPGLTLSNWDDPALSLAELPPIDAVLLSHEDHPDNLDELGRRLLEGRVVFTTRDGAANLSPRPGVVGLAPWETVERRIAGRRFQITATPCQHLPGGECVGFLVSGDGFGVGPGGLPNAVYFSGDTVYVDELAGIAKRFHVPVAVMNLGAAKTPTPNGLLQITMDGRQAARLFRDIGAEWLVPMHYESWGHFTQHGEGLAKDFEEEGVIHRVKWLKPAVAVSIS